MLPESGFETRGGKSEKPLHVNQGSIPVPISYQPDTVIMETGQMLSISCAQDMCSQAITLVNDIPQDTAGSELIGNKSSR